MNEKQAEELRTLRSFVGKRPTPWSILQEQHGRICVGDASGESFVMVYDFDGDLYEEVLKAIEDINRAGEV